MNKPKSWYNKLLAVNLRNVKIKKGVLYIKVVDASATELNDVLNRLGVERGITEDTQCDPPKHGVLCLGSDFTQLKKLLIIRYLIQNLPSQAILLYGLDNCTDFTTNHRFIMSSTEPSDMDTVKWQCYGPTVPSSVWESAEGALIYC